MFSHYQKVLDEISRNLKNRFGDEIEGIYAFGSRVRGDNNDRSDFDLLVVVKNRTYKKTRAVISVIVDTEMKYDMSFIPVVKDSDSFTRERQYNTPFYQNIMKEGISL